MNLMVQGTSSYSGKSFLVMALCRIFSRKGYRVAPFKAQNTSNNSYVTRDGEEIARAQALQAMAAGVEPAVEMNPILVKPKGESRSQIVVLGKPYKDIDAGDYYADFALKEGIGIIREAYRTLEEEYDLIIIEGAGSPAEINLYDCDIANMRVADITGAPVILIADIERGGVFASIHGTLSLLKEEHRLRVKGVLINKFRGDMEILESGLTMIEDLTKKKVLGVIPYINDLRLPDEDSVSLDATEGMVEGMVESMVEGMARGTVRRSARSAWRNSGNAMNTAGHEIAVIRLPRISNFTDFDPLIHSGMNVRFVKNADEIKSPKAIIIPGTKSTIPDLLWMREKGFEEKIKSFYNKALIVGICGGYQMLGKRIIDNGIEGEHQTVDGLGLLDIETRFEGYSKTTKLVTGEVIAENGLFKNITGTHVSGYEIHMGETIPGKNARPLFRLTDGRNDGAADRDAVVFGTYLHGIFDLPGFRAAFIRHICKSSLTGSTGHAGSCRMDGVCTNRRIKEVWDESIDRAAEIVAGHVDIREIERILKGM